MYYEKMDLCVSDPDAGAGPGRAGRRGGQDGRPARPSGVSVQVNGKNVTFPNASPAVINGRTMVPMRAVLETLGAEVDYDGETKTVQAKLGDVSSPTSSAPTPSRPPPARS